MKNILKIISIVTLPILVNAKTIEYIPDTFLSLEEITDKKVTDIMDKDNSCSLFFNKNIFCSNKSIKEPIIKLYFFNEENSQGTVNLKIVDYIPIKSNITKENNKDKNKIILELRKNKFELQKMNVELKKNIEVLLEKNRIKLKECTINSDLKKENDRVKLEIQKISDLLKREKTKSKQEHYKLIKKLEELSNERKLFKDNTESEQVIVLNTQIKNLLKENTSLKNELIQLKHSNKNMNIILKKKDEVIEQYKKMLESLKNPQKPKSLNKTKNTNREQTENSNKEQIENKTKTSNSNLFEVLN